jgi:hypothetical protein
MATANERVFSSRRHTQQKPNAKCNEEKNKPWMNTEHYTNRNGR